MTPQTVTGTARAFLKRFRSGESGAVTIDWVVLTAALLTLGIVMATLISNGATEMSTGAGARLSNAEVPRVSF